MKKLLTLTTLIFTVMFSSTSFAEWQWVSKSVDERTYYVDFERIKKHDGYIYYWALLNYLKPRKKGVWSVKSYQQGDCNLFRFKYLSASFHKEPMGGGTGDVQKPDKKYQGWYYPPPNSAIEISLKSVCEYAN